MAVFLFSDYSKSTVGESAQKAMVFIRMNIFRKGYFLTRLYKSYIYLA